MNMNMIEMIKSAFANPKNKSEEGIGSLTDACSHYRSKAGGKVKANSSLYEEMKNDSSFCKKFINEMTDILTKKVLNANVGDTIRSAPDSNRPANCTTMGMYKLNIEYNHKVTVGKNDIVLHLYGSDLWDFKPSKDKGFLKNLTNEIIPGMIAGDGTPFEIIYDFKYTINIIPKYFLIKSAVNPNYCLDINGASRDNGANVQIYTVNSSDAQQFSFSKCGEYVYIVAKCSGKVLDVDSGGKMNGTNIQQYEYNGSSAQHWKIVKAGNYQKFCSRVNGLYLDLNGGNATNGNNIQCWEGNDSNAQQFILFPTDLGPKKW